MNKNRSIEEIRKKQIIDAALRVVAREGYYNLNMEMVAKEAGMSKGGVAHYFKTKKELFKSVFIKFFEDIFIRGKNEMNKVKDPIEKLTSFIWLFNWDDEDVYKGYPILFDFMSIASKEGEFREIFCFWVDSWIELLSEALCEAKKHGLIDPQVDEQSLARAISALYQGIAERWFLVPDKHSTDWAIKSLKNGVYGLISPFMIKK